MNILSSVFISRVLPLLWSAASWLCRPPGTVGHRLSSDDVVWPVTSQLFMIALVTVQASTLFSLIIEGHVLSEWHCVKLQSTSSMMVYVSETYCVSLCHSAWRLYPLLLLLLLLHLFLCIAVWSVEHTSAKFRLYMENTSHPMANFFLSLSLLRTNLYLAPFISIDSCSV